MAKRAFGFLVQAAPLQTPAYCTEEVTHPSTNVTHCHLILVMRQALITCTYVLLTEKNRRIRKAHLRYPCNFITEFKGRTDSAMKIDMHIFSACTQCGHKHIHFSRVTYERLVHVHFPCKFCKTSPFTCRVCMSRAKHSRLPCIHIKPL